MKIAVFNFSGNVGKTTIVKQMLAPRIPDAEIITVESINTDDSGSDNSDALRGRDFGQVYARVLAADSAVVDVGSSNVEDFIEYMSQYDGAEDIFDLYVVPVVPDTKQQKDTAATIDELNQRGVPAERIRVLFNRADRKTSLEAAFDSIFAFYRSHETFVLNKDAVLYETPAFTAAADIGTTVDEMASNLAAYKSAVGRTQDREERQRLAAVVADAARAVGVSRALDTAFDALTQ